MANTKWNPLWFRGRRQDREETGRGGNPFEGKKPEPGRNMKELVDELLNSAFQGRLEDVKRLIEEEGVDVNARDDEGFTALHAAAVLGWVDIAKYLLEKGADPNAKSKQRITPASIAFKFEHIPFLEVLVEYGSKEALAYVLVLTNDEARQLFEDLMEGEKRIWREN